VLLSMMDRVVAGLLIIVAYVIFLLIKPEKGCGKCSGWGQRHTGIRRRTSACGQCQGTGKQLRVGAQLVHGGMVLAIESIREAIERRQEDNQ
jgi:DnaJ-class molecular chaperone